MMALASLKGEAKASLPSFARISLISYQRVTMKRFNFRQIGFVVSTLCAASVWGNATVPGPLIRPEQPNPGLNAQVPILPMLKSYKHVAYRVEKLPLNATLYYDGREIEAGFTLTDPNKVTIDPDDGNVTAVFSYVSENSEGAVSEPRNIIMRFYDLEVSGFVFYDAEGNGLIDGAPISNLDGKQLYVNLVNRAQEVIASKAVDAKGNYRFHTADGLQPNHKYALILSTEKNSLRSMLPLFW